MRKIELEAWAVLFLGSLGLSVIAWGYVYRIFVDALNGAESLVLPSWRDWWTYWLAGFYLLPIAMGYSVIVIAWLSMMISILGLKMAVIPLLLTLIFYNGFLPIAFARFAAKGRVWMAFEPGPIWQDIRRIVRGDYVQTCFGLFGFSILGNMILSYLPWGGLALASTYKFCAHGDFCADFRLADSQRAQRGRAAFNRQVGIKKPDIPMGNARRLAVRDAVRPAPMPDRARAWHWR